MKKSQNIICETERLIIREFELDDLESVYEYAKQEVVFTYQNWGPMTEAGVLHFIKGARAEINHEPRRNYDLCIVLKEGLKVIGECGLHEIQFEGASAVDAKIGYVIHPAYWNKGFATEVVKGLIAFSRDGLRLDSLTATCDSANTASKKVLTKNGFEFIREKKNDFLQKGRMRDTSVYRYSLP